MKYMSLYSSSSFSQKREFAWIEIHVIIIIRAATFIAFRILISLIMVLLKLKILLVHVYRSKYASMIREDMYKNTISIENE